MIDPFYEFEQMRLYVGDAREVLRELPETSVHCTVTSPPYFLLREYEGEGELGREKHVHAYVRHLGEVFAEVHRVLRDDGVLFLNLGDTYVGKQLQGAPWRVALYLQGHGWWLRNDNVWAKRNPIPEPVNDRCARAHEYVFMLSKGPLYYFDKEAIKEPAKWERWGDQSVVKEQEGAASWIAPKRKDELPDPELGRNPRTVWTYNTANYPDAHHAVMPNEVAEKCILAGTPAGGTVLDPFAGSGTTLMIAQRLGRASIGIELSQEYATQARDRRLVQWWRDPVPKPPVHSSDQLELDAG